VLVVDFLHRQQTEDDDDHEHEQEIRVSSGGRITRGDPPSATR
jgi:hypothetical protein